MLEPYQEEGKARVGVTVAISWLGASNCSYRTHISSESYLNLFWDIESASTGLLLQVNVLCPQAGYKTSGSFTVTRVFIVSAFNKAQISLPYECNKQSGTTLHTCNKQRICSIIIV